MISHLNPQIDVIETSDCFVEIYIVNQIVFPNFIV